MSPSARGWWLLLAAGVCASVVGLGLPWRSDELRLGVPVRALMVLAGVVLLVRVARTPTTAPVGAVGVLGASVLAYPTLLSASTAEVGGPVLEVLAAAGHVLPLTLVQLAPVLASRETVGRRHLRWEALIVATAALGVVLVGLGLAGAPGAGVLLAVSTGLWFGSFLLAPAVTFSAVRGTAGETRHRAVVAALAALVPVVVISWCLALGVLATDVREDAAITALMVGFAVGTCACGILTLGARGPSDSRALRTRTVIASLHAVIGALLLIVGTVAALTVAALGVPATWAAGLGAAAAVLAGLPWRRLHSWVRRVVDPAAGLRHELSLLGQVPDGHHRSTLQHTLRRVVGDPGLDVVYDVGDGLVRDCEDGAVDPADLDGAVVLARRPDGDRAVLARPGSPSGLARLRVLGDCSVALRPAALEAELVHQSRRADLAAETERRRIAQDLHDGLQGRLLGLALHLQLSRQNLTDPGAAMLAEETVQALRAAVDDVRALGGGDLPEILSRDGLRPALSALVAPMGALVELDLPDLRLGAEVEAAAYFVVGEAVSNALKHAEADHIGVRIALSGADQVSVTIRDDGRGGADPRLGSGLRGIAERVTAAGGVLVVHDATPGTTVEAVLPCAW